ncbi:MAG: N-acetylneuraminate synthase [Acidobacteriota bacterium]|nr:N-acetylneuraminate synthase [Acidobacteriota bacterium]
MKTFIVAEAGVNHDGDLVKARRLIDVAASAGADAVKFQTFQADRLVTASAPKAGYQRRTTGAGESQREMLRRLELTPAMHRELMAHCAAAGIMFLSTAFDESSLDLLESLGQERFKIPSGEITNLPYLRHVGRLGRPTLLSTGMADLAEVGEALDVLAAAGTTRELVTVLQCTTEYPAPVDEANLRAMLTMRDRFGVAVGYSDHTPGIEVPLAAVALGACVIEKHFTLDRTTPGPDHRASLEPGELAAMVRAIRTIELALGDGVKRPGPGESTNRAAVRKSIVAQQPILRGEVFSAANITTKRPGTGISPMRWDEIVGRAAPRDFALDELIEL